MKQQDAFKILAAFLISIMIFSAVAPYYLSQRSDTTQQTPEQQSQEKYNPEFWVVNQPFFSISDALNMTPPGAVDANYADIESMTPQMIQWVRTGGLPIINEVDSKVYRSSTTKIYYAGLQNNSFLLLSTMVPERNDFEYIVIPDSYPPVLRRQGEYTGIFNIMGNPVIFAPQPTASDVLKIIYSLNKTATAYDRYGGLLGKVEPASFQAINSNVSFADQFYMGVGVANGSYERTAAYLNINSSTLKKLNQLKVNSTQRGFTQYNLTRSGNYTIIKIVSPQMLNVLNEEVS